MTITVASKRDGATGEYIGRPSILGNPFTIGKDGTRDEVVAKYRRWLNDELQVDVSGVPTELKRLKKLADAGDLTLVCWCAPAACHGDVIKSCIEWMQSRPDSSSSSIQFDAEDTLDYDNPEYFD